MYQALLFDLDGVLLNTEYMAYTIWRDFLKENQNYDLEISTYAKACGGPPDTFDKVMEELIPGDTQALHEYWVAQVLERTKTGRIPVMDGFQELKAYLQTFPGKKGMVTSNGGLFLKGYMGLFKFDEMFDDIVYGMMVQKRKPAPDIYLLACERLGVKPEHCLAVEDSLWGLMAAQNAGVDVLHMEGIPEIPREIKDKCVGSVKNLHDVIRFLQK